mmetsp:Transcript_124156/g.359044  ORF Transcript_124156/g.359044 Transcript_124156/m.359044 type:complete len:210 (-) Transcript_124156:910-1539(-)
MPRPKSRGNRQPRRLRRRRRKSRVVGRSWNSDRRGRQLRPWRLLLGRGQLRPVALGYGVQHAAADEPPWVWEGDLLFSERALHRYCANYEHRNHHDLDDDVKHQHEDQQHEHGDQHDHEHHHGDHHHIEQHNIDNVLGDWDEHDGDEYVHDSHGDVDHGDVDELDDDDHHLRGSGERSHVLLHDHYRSGQRLATARGVAGSPGERLRLR